MEAAGLGIGIIGLTALFSTCVQTWGYFSRARSFSEEFALQQTKLDIEKTLFLQWGRRVGLIVVDSEDEEPDSRLSNENGEVQSAVVSILMCLKQLFTNTEDLRLKYEIFQDELSATDHEHDEGRLSRNLMKTFETWQNRISSHQNGTSTCRKTRWVCRDRDKFVAFVNEISYFNQKLQRLTPISNFLQQSLVRQAVDAIRDDLPTLYLVRNASRNWHKDWSDAASDQITSSEGTVDYANSVTLTAGSIEVIDDWRRHVPERDSIQQQWRETAFSRRAVDPAIINDITQVIQWVAESPSILKKSSHPRMRRIADNKIFNIVQLKLNISRTDLKSRELSTESQEALTVGMQSWMEQAKGFKRIIEAGRKLKGGFDAFLYGSQDEERWLSAIVRETTELTQILELLVSNAIRSTTTDVVRYAS